MYSRDWLGYPSKCRWRIVLTALEHASMIPKQLQEAVVLSEDAISSTLCSVAFFLTSQHMLQNCNPWLKKENLYMYSYSFFGNLFWSMLMVNLYKMMSLLYHYFTVSCLSWSFETSIMLCLDGLQWFFLMDSEMNINAMRDREIDACDQILYFFHFSRSNPADIFFFLLIIFLFV